MITTIIILTIAVLITMAVGIAIGFSCGLRFREKETLDVMRKTEDAMRSVTRAIEQRNEDAEWRGFNRGN